MSTLRAGVVQFDVKRGDTDSNWNHVRKSLNKLISRGVDIIVLPEMWTSGFDYSRLKRHAGETPGLLEGLSHFAKSHKVFISGTMPEQGSQGIYNTAFLVDSKGVTRASYRKIHLFTPGGEGRFLPGNTPVVTDSPWGKIGLVTCYDLRFPEISRALALAGAEILLVHAQWPEARIAHWDVLLQARAVENQLFVIAANRCGKDPSVVYGGHSRIISPYGELLARAGKRGALLDATLDLSEIRQFRKKIPCFSQRVPEAYAVKDTEKA